MPADPTAVRSKRATARRRIEEKRAAEAAARARAQRRRRTAIGGSVAAVLVVVALVVVYLVQSSRTAPSANAAVPAHVVDGTVIPVGSAKAPVTVDLYEDFQCPNCKAFEAATGTTLAKLVADGTVQARYHGMAFLDTSANHDYSSRALNAAAVVVDAAGPTGFQKFHDLLYAHQPAEGGSGLTDEQLVEYAVQAGANAGAVVAAAGPTAFQAFHDLLFANQPAETGSGLTDAQLVQYAGQAGASGSAVEQAIQNLTYGDWVKKVTDQASKDGVTGTPTVRVNGKALADLSASGLSAAVKAAQAG